jgi:dTDP-6-deoxy-L-talose 4-dehydrogenase (NAD+)
MRILLTGASGFIGSRFMRRALAQGHEVAGLSRREIPPDKPSEPPVGASRITHHPSRPPTWLQGSLEDAPWKQIEAFRPEACVHCAWSTAPTFSYDSPGHFRYLEWSRSFLQRALDAGARYLMGMGTCLEYRIGDEPLVEDRTPLAPLGPYAESKNAMRAWLEEESRRQNFRFCWGRGFYVYGGGEDPTRLCSSIVQKLRRNEPVVLNTPQSTKDYIYIDDVVGALFLLFEKQAAGTFNIGSGIGVTVWELAQTLAGMLEKPDLVKKGAHEKADPLGYVVGDITKLRRLGWQPEYALTRGLRALIAVLESEGQ